MSELLNQYVKDCLRTEAKLEQLKINPEVVGKLFTMFEELSEILDGLKKYSFYGKDEKFSSQVVDRLEKINNISSSLINRPKSFLLQREDVSLNSRMFHGILGIMTEAGELSQIWSKHMQGEEFDPVHVQEELGDQHWYHSIINDELKIDPAATLDKNIRKLKTRFPDKYSNEAAANRNLDAERQELEK